MVITRARHRAPVDDGSPSSDNNSIPPQLPRPRGPATGTPATLRPRREAAPARPGPTKRKRTSTPTSHEPPPKHPRQDSGVGDSIEVQEKEDDALVDEAIKATGTRPTSRLATGTRPKSRLEVAIESRPRIRKLGPRTRSREIIGDLGLLQLQKSKHGNGTPQTTTETAEPERHTKPAQEEESSNEAQGSPELQSSALKRRRAKPSADIYDVPQDEEPGTRSLVLRGLRTTNGLELSSRSNTSKKPAPKGPPRQRNTRLSSIREEEQQPQPGSRRPPARAAHQPRPPRQVPGDPSPSADDEDDELEEPEEIGGADFEEGLAVLIEVRRYNPSEPTISVFSDHINHMSEAMGKSGWTADGRRWGAEICQFREEPPARTRVGKAIFKSLSRLADELDNVPNSLDPVGQARILDKQNRVLNAVMSSVEGAVTRIVDLAAPAGSGHETTIDFLTALASDLSTWVIPMLVLVLQTAFAIGIEEPDAEVRDALPRKGVFTWTTVQYVQWTSSWLFRLEKVLATDLGQRTGEVANSSGDQQQDPDNPMQSRQRFGVMVRKWMQHLKEAVRGFNDKSDRDREIYEMRQRDLAIKERQRREEEQDLARSRKQEEAFWSSLRNMSSQPRPMAEKFRKATGHWNWDTLAAPTPQPIAVSQRPGPSAAIHPRSRSHPVSAPGMRAPAPAALPPLVLDYPSWAEDEVEWFLGELRRPNRSRGYLEVCAETLERPLEEVRTERERLRRSGRYQSPAPGR